MNKILYGKSAPLGTLALCKKTKTWCNIYSSPVITNASSIYEQGSKRNYINTYLNYQELLLILCMGMRTLQIINENLHSYIEAKGQFKWFPVFAYLFPLFLYNATVHKNKTFFNYVYLQINKQKCWNEKPWFLSYGIFRSITEDIWL